MDKGSRTGLTTEQRHSLNLDAQIKGWGADLDPSVRPGVPRDKAPGIGVETLYPQFDQQIPLSKIHLSTEHQRMTPVFGTACPPKGLSGLLRDFAYRQSEGRKAAHWMLLMLADRVDVIENIGRDLAHGCVPNVFNEMGWSAEMKYNREGFKRKVIGTGIGALAAAAILIIVARAKRSEKTT